MFQVFAFVCTAAFAYEVLRKFAAFNNGELAQGSRQMVQAVNQTPCWGGKYTTKKWIK